jgi:type II secretory pathway predicted ATPase ExeA/tetratricopeptide (TPR) repeat protein
MYDSFYSVAENPFKICTDPRFLWCSEKHSQVLSSLIYGLMDHNGLVVLTGDIGTGKTTLVNALLKILGTDVYVAKISHPSLDAIEFLTLVAKSLDPNFTGTDKSELLLFFNSLFRRVRAEGKIVLLIIDEAQHLSMELLEEIRLLSNMEQAGQRILSIMLVGQTELKPMIESPQSRSLRQRVTLFCEIQALSEKETPLYVEYRLKVSGLREQLFTSRAMQMIHTFSQGNPRLINILCDRAMRIGYMKKHKKIDMDIIIECARDMKIGNRVKVKVFDLLGPELLTWRQELSFKLKRWSTNAGPTFQKAQTWVRHQGKVIIPQILSRCRALTDKLVAVCGRLIKEYRCKTHPSVWMVGIGLIVIVLTINAFKTTHDENHPTVAAVKTDAQDQWTATASSGNAQWANSEKAPEDPTLLVSTSPSASRLWYREPARQGTVTDRQPEPESLNPASQPTTKESEPTPAQLAALALERKDYQKAIELLEARRNTGVEEDRKSSGLYSDALLGRALETMATSPSKAEAMLLRAIDVTPDNAQAYLTLGKYRTRTKEYAQAIDAYQHAIHLDPNLSDALFNLGFVYATTGKLEDAETAFSEAVQLRPPYLGKSLFNLAVVQQKLGKKEQSLANLEKAVVMMPQNEKALAYLNQVKHSATGSRTEQSR